MIRTFLHTVIDDIQSRVSCGSRGQCPVMRMWDEKRWRDAGRSRVLRAREVTGVRGFDERPPVEASIFRSKCKPSHVVQVTTQVQL